MSDPTENAPGHAENADISDEEVEALLEKTGSGDVGSADGAERGIVESYDLIAPDKILRARMPALDRINERWVEQFQQTLSDLVRRPVEVSVEDAQIIPYGEWQSTFEASASFSLLTVNPWRGSALIAVGSELLFLMVETYYGGSGRKGELPDGRPLTQSEVRFNRILIDKLTAHFKDAFEPIAQIQFEHQNPEVNPNYAAIATPSERVVVTELHISLNESVGSICVVLPLSLLEPVREKLTEGLKTISPESKERWYQGIVRQLESAELDISSVFLDSDLSMRDLLSLKPGDILPIEMPKTTLLYAGGQPLLCGKFGRSRGYNAVSIVEKMPSAWIDDNEESSAHE